MTERRLFTKTNGHTTMRIEWSFRQVLRCADPREPHQCAIWKQAQLSSSIHSIENAVNRDLMCYLDTQDITLKLIVGWQRTDREPSTNVYRVIGNYYIADLDRRNFYIVQLLEREYPQLSGNWQHEVDVRQVNAAVLAGSIFKDSRAKLTVRLQPEWPI